MKVQDGKIDFKLTNIALSAEGQYTWGVGTTSSADEVGKWYTLADFGETTKTAILTLTPEDYSMRNILRTTNTAWLYVKDIKNNNYIVNALKVDLTLPALKAFEIIENPNSSTNRSFEVNTVYNMYDSIYYKIEKVTDKELINEYQAAIAEGKEVSSISSLAKLSEAPEAGWKTIDSNYNSAGAYIDKKPTEEGLYYIWVKAKNADSKTVIGYSLYYGDINGPTVEKIYVSSPEAGTYKTGQTVKIRVGFSEPIVGSTVPTLKIKFGDSKERSVTNGTIVNSGSGDYYWQHYIEYSYNIQDSDKGQLATVSLSGGTIKDAKGNDAKLSCPIITGNTIKANAQGTTTNNTENQDKNNNNQTNNNKTNNNKTNNNTTTETNKQNTTNNNTTNETKKENTTVKNENKKPTTTTTKKNNTDNTTAPGDIPYTGGTFTIIVTILLIAGLGIYGYKRNNDLKGI